MSHPNRSSIPSDLFNNFVRVLQEFDNGESLPLSNATVTDVKREAVRITAIDRAADRFPKEYDSLLQDSVVFELPYNWQRGDLVSDEVRRFVEETAAHLADKIGLSV